MIQQTITLLRVRLQRFNLVVSRQRHQHYTPHFRPLPDSLLYNLEKRKDKIALKTLDCAESILIAIIRGEALPQSVMVAEPLDVSTSILELLYWHVRYVSQQLIKTACLSSSFLNAGISKAARSLNGSAFKI